MSTGVISNLGTTIGITASAPATFDAAGFSALSYTAIAEVVDLSELGITSAEITHTPIDSGTVFKFKGAANYGDLALKLGKYTADAGQTLLTAAAAASAAYSFHITEPGGRDYYFTGRVMTLKSTIGAINQVIGLSATIGINSVIVETA